MPQWFGETIGFWDGETLVAWTARVQGWNQHTMFEYDDKMEAVETFKAVRDAAGKVVGMDTEAVFYDPAVLVQPVRLYDHMVRTGSGNDPGQTTTYIRCLSNVRNVNGKPTQLGEGDQGFVDYYGVPGPRTGSSTSRRAGTSPSRKRSPATSATSSSDAAGRLTAAR